MYCSPNVATDIQTLSTCHAPWGVKEGASLEEVLGCTASSCLGVRRFKNTARKHGGKQRGVVLC